MNITRFFRSLMGKFFDTTEALFSDDFQSAKRKIESLPYPQNDIKRSINQYICTMNRMPMYKRVIVSFAGLICYIPYFLYMFINGKKEELIEKVDAIYFTDRISVDTIPISVRNRFPVIKCINLGTSMSIGNDDIKKILELVKVRPFSPYFQLKLLMKIGMASSCIRKYGPKAIIHYSESSFATSIVSQYCERKNVSYIGIMHGERLYGLKLPFFRCTEYYAWDQDYIDLFISMRCESTQFRVEIPDSLKLPQYVANSTPIYDYTFYLQNETDESINRLSFACQELSKKGNAISIRPHPLDDYNFYKEKFFGIDIQNPKDISLCDSFENTKYVVSKFSTVLYQAWYLGINIVIDDYTMPGVYEKLQDLGYVMIKKPHTKLSERIQGEENDP